VRGKRAAISYKFTEVLRETLLALQSVILLFSEQGINISFLISSDLSCFGIVKIEY
jgi:hypothetical protein